MFTKLFRSARTNLIFLNRQMNSSSATGEYSMCITTLSKDEDARRLARLLVENHLAACVNLVPGVQSIYEWQSKIHEDNEIILIIKTRRDSVQQLIEFVKKNHPYDVPELIELPILSGNPDYLKWIDSIVKRSST